MEEYQSLELINICKEINSLCKLLQSPDFLLLDSKRKSLHLKEVCISEISFLAQKIENTIAEETSVEKQECEEVCISKDYSNEEISIDSPIEDLNLSVRSYNCLKRANINTVGDILHMNFHELENVRNLGKRGVEEIFLKVQDVKKNMVLENKR